jgi:hypothetical protein
MRNRQGEAGRAPFPTPQPSSRTVRLGLDQVRNDAASPSRTSFSLPRYSYRVVYGYSNATLRQLFKDLILTARSPTPSLSICTCAKAIHPVHTYSKPLCRLCKRQKQGSTGTRSCRVEIGTQPVGSVGSSSNTAAQLSFTNCGSAEMQLPWLRGHAMMNCRNETDAFASPSASPISRTYSTCCSKTRCCAMELATLKLL